jgi:dolichol-phosphate mannosyltransferase
VIGFILSVVVVIDKIVNHTPVGGASVMLVVLLTSSFQMIMMGVLGEYLWRNLDETRRRPLYVIEKVVSRKDEDGE